MTRDFSHVSIEEALCEVIAERFFQLTKIIGEDRAASRLAALMGLYRDVPTLELMSYFNNLGECVTHAEISGEQGP